MQLTLQKHWNIKFNMFQNLFTARPYFPYSIGNRLTDPGTTVRWRCKAVGRPKPTYTWYKDGEILQTEAGRIDVVGSELIITNVSVFLYLAHCCNFYWFLGHTKLHLQTWFYLSDTVISSISMNSTPYLQIAPRHLNIEQSVHLGIY